MQVTVTTKEELKKAIADKVDIITITGELAANVKKTEKIKKVGRIGIAALMVAVPVVVAGFAMTPATGGVSSLVAVSAVATAATLTGMEIAIIIAVCFMGVGMLVALHKEYDELGFTDFRIFLYTFSKKYVMS